MNVNAAVRVLEFLDTAPVKFGVCAALTPVAAIMGGLGMFYLTRESDPVGMGILAFFVAVCAAAVYIYLRGVYVVGRRLFMAWEFYKDHSRNGCPWRRSAQENVTVLDVADYEVIDE